MTRDEIYSSMEIKKSDKTRLNRVRGEQDLKTYSDALRFLLDLYNERR